MAKKRRRHTFENHIRQGNKIMVGDSRLAKCKATSQ